MIPLHDKNPTEITPIFTVGLILINIAVFGFQISLGQEGQRFVVEFGAIPWEITHFSNHPQSMHISPYISILSSMFLHGGLMHLGGNMLYLWIFGNNIEDAMGHLRFIIFYATCGLIAAFCHVFSSPDSVVPMIGASGAISGVLGGYLILYPGARVTTIILLGWFIRIADIPAVILLGFWFILQLISSLITKTEGGGVAWFAHIGGFIAGMILVGLFKRPRKHCRRKYDYEY